MKANILISVISDDKPGVIEAIAEVVRQNEGNWFESNLSELAGKFAGIIHVAVPHDHLDNVRQQLNALETQDIWVKIDQLKDKNEDNKSKHVANFHALGPDRPGIVLELSKAFKQHAINVSKLETGMASMPYTGEALFEAKGRIEIPDSVDMPQLHEKLDSIADALALDISLTELDEKA